MFSALGAITQGSHNFAFQFFGIFFKDLPESFDTCLKMDLNPICAEIFSQPIGAGGGVTYDPPFNFAPK